MQYFKKRWLHYSIDRKVQTFAFFVGLTLAVAVIFSVITMNFSIRGYGDILAANLSCQEFLDAMNAEQNAFRRYMEDRSEARYTELGNAQNRTKRAVAALPFSYEEIGADRYERTWNIVNAYPVYEAARDGMAIREDTEDGYIEALYQVYGMQEYLDSYARRLLQATVAEGSHSYVRRLPFFRTLPFLLLNLTLVIAYIMLRISKLMTDSVVAPVKLLSEEAKQISHNQFQGPDLIVENKDEIGELVDTFNIMKRSMGNYIETLKENHQMTELLQKEQMEHMEMEKRLDQNRMELLKSQINPHFLFNTLNMIGSMADLEEAETTEKMTQCLSRLFRYNLSTREQIVPLSQELEVAENYMYLQKMRFGARVEYVVSLPEDISDIRIPSFTLQPLIENSIVHGISKKESGGRVKLVVTKKPECVKLYVMDNGLGMTEERKQELLSLLQQEKPSFETRIGIGLGNIYLRVRRLYGEGRFKIYSKKDIGTAMVIHIPILKEKEGKGMPKGV